MTPPEAAAAPRTRRLRALCSSTGALLLAGLAVSCAPAQAPIEMSGANLLLITIDTLRADRLGAYGDEQAATPTLDRLAESGVRFASTYAPVPLTLPSHSSMFTGRYPFTLQVRNNGGYVLEAEEETLAERLRAADYSTAAFVSSYVLAAKFGLDQGFDVYDDTLDGHDLIQSFTSELPADRVVDRFEKWVRSQGVGPFFAWLHFYDPHLPYAPPEPFATRFADDLYRAEIAFVDSQIGRAIGILDAESLMDNTLVVVTSDHGESFGEHGETGHGILTYEESLRVPLILNAGARLPQGLEIDHRVRLVDLAPTVLDLLDLPPHPAEQPGRSLVPLIESPSTLSDRPPNESEVYFESVLGSEDYNWAPITGLISGNHKYISLPQPELYDLDADAAERKNLFHSHPAVAEELDSRLRELLLSGGGSDIGSRRELSDDDRAHLQALGYLGAVERSATVIDPKQGIRIDQEIKRIRSLVDRGSVAEAKTSADALALASADVQMAGLYALRHEIEARLGHQQQAILLLEQGVEALPRSERLRFLLAHYLLQTGNLQQAAEVAGELTVINPRFSQAWIVLGQVAEKQGDSALAIEHYDKALQSEPRSLPLRRHRAEALLRTGALSESSDELIALADLNAFADEPEQLYRVAVLASQAGRADQAERLFRRGLDIAPAGIHHITFSLLLLRNEKPGEARQHLDTALARYGNELTSDQRAMARATLDQLAANEGR